MRTGYDFSRAVGLYPGLWLPRPVRAVKNTYWFDKNGEFVGLGDLSIDQPKHVADHLDNGEILAILPGEAITNWQSTLIDRVLGRTAENPGHTYVAQHFKLLITPRCIYLPGADGNFRDDPKFGELPTISPDTAVEFMLEAQKLN